MEEKYSGFGPTLASEQMASEDQLEVHPETLRRWMLEVGLWKRARKRKQHRRRRDRRAHFGELVQMDGSFHDWYQGRAPKACLMNMVDDATSTVEARMGEQETIWAAARVLRQWMEKYGVPLALYTDWKNVYVREPTEKELLHGKAPVTQFGRMCQRLDIRIIAANSPQAKGREERGNGTHQDRLIKKMGRKKIRTHEAANEFLQQHYLPITTDGSRGSPPSRKIIIAGRRLRGSWNKCFAWKPSGAFQVIGWCAMRIAIFSWSGPATTLHGKPR